jgi:hypothetical protein
MWDQGKMIYVLIRYSESKLNKSHLDAKVTNPSFKSESILEEKSIPIENQQTYQNLF